MSPIKAIFFSERKQKKELLSSEQQVTSLRKSLSHSETYSIVISIIFYLVAVNFSHFERKIKKKVEKHLPNFCIFALRGKYFLKEEKNQKSGYVLLIYVSRRVEWR
jgi:hypothetical protein